MGWVSPKVYAILKNSEEGKDILQGLADKDQKQVDKEVDAFFGKGGKGGKGASQQENNKTKEYDEEDGTYKGYGIDYNIYGQKEYTVSYNGDDIWFDNEKDAKNFVDKLLENSVDLSEILSKEVVRQDDPDHTSDDLDKIAKKYNVDRNKLAKQWEKENVVYITDDENSNSASKQEETKKSSYGNWKLTPEIEKSIRSNFKNQKEAEDAVYNVFGMGFDDGTEEGNARIKDFNNIMKAIADIYKEKPYKEYKSAYDIFGIKK